MAPLKADLSMEEVSTKRSPESIRLRITESLHLGATSPGLNLKAPNEPLAFPILGADIAEFEL